MFLLRDLNAVRVLGEGSYGKVFLVSFEGLSGVKMKKHYALKVISKAKILQNKQLSHVYNEKTVMLSVCSPFFVRLYSTFQDEKHLFMVMEYVPGGELFSYMKDIIKLSASHARFYIAEILIALKALHRAGIVYRDLKPENILLDEEGHIKLADFGFSKRLFNPTTWTLCGTPEYLAPEIVLNKGHSFEVDFWSLGVILYEMVVGVPPFYHENHIELCKQIIQGKVGFPPFVDAVTRDLIKRLLTAERKRRLGSGKGVKAVCAHPFFKGISWCDVEKRRCVPPIVPVKPKSIEQTPYEGQTIRMHMYNLMNDPPVIDQVFDNY